MFHNSGEILLATFFHTRARLFFRKSSEISILGGSPQNEVFNFVYIFSNLMSLKLNLLFGYFGKIILLAFKPDEFVRKTEKDFFCSASSHAILLIYFEIRFEKLSRTLSESVVKF